MLRELPPRPSLPALSIADQQLYEKISIAFWALDKSHHEIWHKLMQQLHERLAYGEQEKEIPDLPRYGIQWVGPKEPIAVLMADGYWTPWHLAIERRHYTQAELNEAVQIAIERTIQNAKEGRLDHKLDHTGN